MKRGAGTPPSAGCPGSPIPEVGHRRGAPHADREPHLHARIVVAQRARPARVLEQQAVRVLEVDRLHPLVVDDGGHPHALRNQLGALRRERLERAELEGEVVEHVGRPRPRLMPASYSDGMPGTPRGSMKARSCPSPASKKTWRIWPPSFTAMVSQRTASKPRPPS